VRRGSTVQINLTYRGGLRYEAVRRPSGQTLLTDAPVGSHGKGEGFSPTDLVATALGACIPTIMGIMAEREKIDLSGMRIPVGKEMSVEPPRRIAKLRVARDPVSDSRTGERWADNGAAATIP
jgi:putative redox protein